MRVTLFQHPVGQGGMMSGVLKLRGGLRQFHWVYDCGSNQEGDLNREIESVAEQGDVDCLFISHLDSDHVSGIDDLLLKVRVREVVLPYLNNVDRMIAIAHDASRGSLTGMFISFLDDVNGWLSARGVQHITYISPQGDGDEGRNDGPDFPSFFDPFEPRTQIEFKQKWSRLSIETREQGSESVGTSEGKPAIQKFETGVSLAIETKNGPINWIFVPYAYRPSSSALQDFTAQLNIIMPNWQNDREVRLKILKDKLLREKLRKSYDLIWSDHNLVSMALYTGPFLHVERYYGYEIKTQVTSQRRRSKNNIIGWLGTGDMPLNVKRRRDKFFTHYAKLLEFVNVFGLPHHGAERNFDPSLLDATPNAKQYVASAGKNGYGHPSKSVKLAIELARKNFVKVSSKPHSRLVWSHFFRYW